MIECPTLFPICVEKHEHVFYHWWPPRPPLIWMIRLTRPLDINRDEGHLKVTHNCGVSPVTITWVEETHSYKVFVDDFKFVGNFKLNVSWKGTPIGGMNNWTY